LVGEKIINYDFINIFVSHNFGINSNFLTYIGHLIFSIKKVNQYIKLNINEKQSYLSCILYQVF